MNNKTKEELMERIEELEEELQSTQSYLDDANESVDDLAIDNAMLEEFRENKEELVQSAWDSGYESGDKKEPQLKSWLNYKIGARI